MSDNTTTLATLYGNEVEEFNKNADVYLTGLKDSVKKLTAGDINEELDNIIHVLKSAHQNGQEDLISKLLFFISVKKKEYEIIEAGFSTYLDMEPLLKGMERHNEIHMIYLRNYTRYIPEDVSEKLRLCKEKNLFDDYLVLYTDYTGRSGEALKKSGQKKSVDPILFGLYKGKIKVHSDISPIKELSNLYDRIFVIGDWIDEDCDLTLEKFIEKAGKNNKGKYAIEVHDIKYEIDEPLVGKASLIREADELLKKMSISENDLKVKNHE